MVDFNFRLSLSLSLSLSETLNWTLKSGLRPKFNLPLVYVCIRTYLDRKFGLSLSLSEITSLFDLSLDLDRTLPQRKAQRTAKSKVKVDECQTIFFPCSVESSKT